MTPSAQPGEHVFVLDKTGSPAKLEGRAVPIGEALAKAAQLLAGARFPLVVAGGDLASVNAALDLAEHFEAGFDVANSGASLSELKALEDFGGYVTSQREAVERADLVLCVGAKAVSEAERLFSVPAPLTYAKRPILTIPAAPQTLKIELASLAALASANSAPSLGDPRFDASRQLVERLKKARFGVAVWSPQELDSLEAAALMILIDKLNATTRFTALPLRDRGWGGSQLCISRWGLFPPARWVGGAALPPPPGATVESMIQEADLLVAVACETALPPWPSNVAVPSITIGPAAALPPFATVSMETAEAGRDCSAVYYEPRTDAYAASPGKNTGGKPEAYQLVRELLVRAGAI